MLETSNVSTLAWWLVERCIDRLWRVLLCREFRLWWFGHNECRLLVPQQVLNDDEEVLSLNPIWHSDLNQVCR